LSQGHREAGGAKSLLNKIMTSKCNICGIMKNTDEFYTGRARCKECHNHRHYKMELYKCEICNITIRKASQKKHYQTKRHDICKFFNEQYDSSKLQRQNQRSVVET
jgi:hypothetical protein